MFELPDELFVSEAYLRVLGRPVDPAGYLDAVAALRHGRSRLQVLASLQGSDEARARGTGRALPRPAPHVAADLWPGGRREFEPVAALRRLRRWLPTRTAEVLALRGALFGQAACVLYLRRAATESDLAAIDGDDDSRSRWLAAVRRAAPLRRRLWPLMPVREAPRRAPPEPGPQARPSTDAPPMAGAPRELHGTTMFTIATRGYLPFVRVLMASLAAQHPEFNRVLVLVEDILEPGDEGAWHLLRAADLGLPGFDDMTVRYATVELCTALKPFCFRWLLEHAGSDRALYLDPDIRLYARLDGLLKLWDAGAGLVLTPHVLGPLPDDGEPDTLGILRSGVFNLGFAGVQRAADSLAFLAWWAERMRTDALVDFERNLFTDQRWCDMAPAFVPSLAVWRHRGCNVAYWNLPQRTLLRDASGCLQAGSMPLIFFHFSGFDPEAPTSLSRYQTRSLSSHMPALATLLADYAASLHASGWQTARARRPGYDSIDGVAVPAVARRLYRELHPQPAAISRGEALDLLLRQCELPGSSRPSLLMRRIHAWRTDLQAAFDLDTERGRVAYAGWFWAAGVIEHELEGLMRRARSR